MVKNKGKKIIVDKKKNFNYAPILIIVVMVAFLSILVLPSIHFGNRDSNTQLSLNPSSMCKEGLTQQCSIGSCSGISICSNGVWSVCSWEKVCVPATKANCLSQGCSTGYKVCNECGSAYSQCINN